MDSVTRNILIAAGSVVLACVIAAGSFFGGAAWQRGRDGSSATISANTADRQNGLNSSGQGGPGQTGPGGQGFRLGAFRGGTSGTVQAISGNNVTVKLADGTVETVTITADTVIAKSQTAAAADLAAGETVQILGTPGGNAAGGDSGTLTARQITIKQ